VSKRPPRVLAQIADDIGWVRGSDAHHLIHVLRARPGDLVTVLDGGGGSWHGRIERIGAGEAAVRLLLREPTAAPRERVLCCGLIRPARWDWLVEKAVELEATRIVPLTTERSHRVPAALAEAKRARWEKLARAACKQSGRPDLPRIDAPRAVAELRSCELPPARLLLSAAAGAVLHEVAPGLRAGGIALAVGPEGGFTPLEEQQLLDLDFRPVRLGPRILRVETAALAALAALL